jgi:hypothetical protein
MAVVTMPAVFLPDLADLDRVSPPPSGPRPLEVL